MSGKRVAGKTSFKETSCRGNGLTPVYSLIHPTLFIFVILFTTT